MASTHNSHDPGLIATSPAQPHGRDGGLLAIAIFKLAKAIFFFSLGIGAFHLLHRDLDEEVMKLARVLRFEPEGHLVGLILHQVNRIDPHRLRMIGLGTFGYSLVSLTEGIGLMLEKTWAEYLTLILTISFLPWEMYELIHDPNWLRAGLLLINLAVLAYLIWLLRRIKRREQGIV